MLFEHIISLIAPHACLSCSKEGSLLCSTCAQMVLPAVHRCYRCQQPSTEGLTCPACSLTAPIRQAHAATSYTGIAKDLLWRLKAERAQAAAQPIGRLMLPHIGSADIITYAPTAPKRARERGYDQSQRIARCVAQYAHLPMIPLLARVGSDRQIGSNRELRLLQMRHAFRPINMHAAQNKRVVLIDDVITTGSTVEAAAYTLRDVGAAEVRVVTFAQA